MSEIAPQQHVPASYSAIDHAASQRVEPPLRIAGKGSDGRHATASVYSISPYGFSAYHFKPLYNGEKVGFEFPAIGFIAATLEGASGVDTHFRFARTLTAAEISSLSQSPIAPQNYRLSACCGVTPLFQ